MTLLWLIWMPALVGQSVGVRPLETQHAFEVGVALNPKTQLILHSRGRTNPGGVGLYQLRVGPIVKYAFHRKAALLGGYYAAVQKQQERDVKGIHRPFGGIEWQAVEKGGAAVELRSLAERFVAGGADFARYRHRIRLSATGSAAPYVSGEWFVDRKGLRSVRYSGGIRWRYSPQIELDAGYFYEPRRGDLGGNRHMILTSIHFRVKTGRRPDPDI